jgi:hypothetical protein
LSREDNTETWLGVIFGFTIAITAFIAASVLAYGLEKDLEIADTLGSFVRNPMKAFRSLPRWFWIGCAIYYSISFFVSKITGTIFGSMFEVERNPFIPRYRQRNPLAIFYPGIILFNSVAEAWNLLFPRK